MTVDFNGVADAEFHVAEFLKDVLDGLSGDQKTLPCKYFYDDHGSKLFEQICEVEEYYLTRTETSILRSAIVDLVEQLGTGGVLVEPGAGSGEKTRLLLDSLRPQVYVPIDISGDYLGDIAEQLAEDFEDVAVVPVAGDFTSPLELPLTLDERRDRVVFFPGSTLGNFTPPEAVKLLTRWQELVGPTGRLLLGIDVAKDAATLEAAYDDQAGVTGRFNLNLLRRINDELGGDFVLEQFTHRAVYRPEQHRVEMHLVSDVDQDVEIAGRAISFSAGEHIHTENSHKYPADVFADIARQAGYVIEQTWADKRDWFHVHCLRLA